MAQVHLYYLMPESMPLSHAWMNQHSYMEDDYIEDKSRIIDLIKEIEDFQNCLKLEYYTGYFDASNVKKFLEDYDIVEDCYPQPLRVLLQQKLKSWYNWRDNPEQLIETTYSLHEQPLAGHTFCEIAQRQAGSQDDNFVLLNHNAHNLGNPILLTIAYVGDFTIENAQSEYELTEWFAENRLPARNFQIIPKHGENRTQGQSWRGQWASPLRCSRDEAAELLKRAVGDDVRELFNLDGRFYIVFKYEVPTPSNMYHGYHVPLDSVEVPSHIKSQLQSGTVS